MRWGRSFASELLQATLMIPEFQSWISAVIERYIIERSWISKHISIVRRVITMALKTEENGGQVIFTGQEPTVNKKHIG